MLYGTTFYGGSAPSNDMLCNGDGGVFVGCGTVFQLTPPSVAGGTWTESVLYSFTGSNGDGSYPTAGVIVGKNGELYGTTEYGGTSTSCYYYSNPGCGTIYKLTPPVTPGGQWTETVLWSFSGQDGSGAMPLAGLALASDGTLYGTTSGGGMAGVGTVFALKP